MQTRSRSIFHIFTLLTLIAMLFGILPASRVQAESLASPLYVGVTFTVNSILDEIDDDTSDGLCHSAANHCTLRAAIMQANKMTGPGVTINLPAGTYTLTRPPAGADGEDNGDLNLTTPASGNPVITISGAGVSTTIIDANQLDRVLSLATGRTASISGITLRNGNTLSAAGGIYNNGTLTVTNSTLSGNSAGFSAGGILNIGTLTLTNSTLFGNSAVFRAGGIFNNAGTLTVTNSTLSGNSTSGDGGGIFNDQGTLTAVTNSTLSGNSAGNGGGIFNDQGTLIVVNSTISQNNANTDGGGIYNTSIANIYNTTIYANGADANADLNGTGGGVYNSPTGTFALLNTLVAGNNLSDAPVYNDCYGTLISYGRNLFWSVTGGCTVLVASGSWATLNSLSSIGPLQNNGGPTFTRALLPGSNAIDASHPAQGCVDKNSVTLTTDQRGAPRGVGALCDIGAYEFSPDNTPPSISSITRVNANPTAASSVDFAVTFSESVTGVDIGDFNLTTSGASGATISGVSGTGNSYTVTVNTGATNGSIRLDVVNNGTIRDAVLNPMGADFTSGETYTISKSPTFADVPYSYWANSYIERLYNAGITGGCSAIPLNYCPDNTVTRAQMAVFLLKVMHGSIFTPPDVGGSTGFSDVATSYWAAAWIKQLAAEGITGGCGVGIYCPDATVTRAQMAVFLLKAKHGSSYSPPAATGVFSDVPVGYWADKWIEQLAVEGVTSGCGAGIYCPDTDVTRAQMAVFLVKAFNLP